MMLSNAIPPAFDIDKIIVFSGKVRGFDDGIGFFLSVDLTLG